jgi:type III secretion system needle length determinant
MILRSGSTLATGMEYLGEVMNTIEQTQGAPLPRQPETTSPPAAPPAAEAQSEFSQLLNRKEGDAPRFGQTLREENRHDGDLSSLMSSLFSERMGGNPLAVREQQPQAVEVGAPAASSRVQDTVEQLVQQILVSHPDQAGDREVRLVLQDRVLPDTEVRLSRGADGLLSVSLLTGRDDAFQTLVSAQTALQERLAIHEQREVRVVVTQTQGGQTSDDASGRRSATYAAYQDGDESSASGGTGKN